MVLQHTSFVLFVQNTTVNENYNFIVHETEDTVSSFPDCTPFLPGCNFITLMLFLSKLLTVLFLYLVFSYIVHLHFVSCSVNEMFDLI